MEITRQPTNKASLPLGRIRTYAEIAEYLDTHWSTKRTPSLDFIKQLDEALGCPSLKTPAILIAGSNGKSLTAHFAAALLKKEGLVVGSFYTPHILNYTERIILNDEQIHQKAFCDIVHEVITAAEQLGTTPHSHEILTLTALIYFAQHKADVALLEVFEDGAYDATNVCHAKAAAITRITPKDLSLQSGSLADTLKKSMGIVKEGTWVVAGDQIKAHLQLMQEMTEAQKGKWAMPIRKLAQLPYPFEQLHGRCAALAERIAQLYLEHCMPHRSGALSESLLTKPRGQRGRPTIEQKKQLELNPRKTIEQFWKEVHCSLPGRFQLLEKERPSVLLDNASNIDAFNNLLLGVRLIHYKKQIKGLTLIIAASKNTLHHEEFFKAVRYFFKKMAGQIFICPLEQSLVGHHEDVSWDAEAVTQDIKNMKVKARAFKTFEEAFETAKKSFDDRNSLIVVTGSHSIIRSYWKYKGIKKV